MKLPSPDFKRLSRTGIAGWLPAGAQDAGAKAARALLSLAGRKATTTRLRLQTLLLLRWMAIVGQTAAVLTVQFVLRHDVPLLACALPIGASLALNLYLWLRHPATKRLSEREAALQMAWDILQLGALLYLTGGLLNPFAILLLAPVTIAAGTLSRTSVILLVLLSLTCATLIGAFGLHQDLPWPPAEDFTVPRVYEFGVFFALAIGLMFFSMFAWRISAEQGRMSDALAATEIVLAREQRLSAVGGLAAAAAHELGSPLATLSVVARELERAIGGKGPLAEDVALLKSETERCRAILHRLTLEAQALSTAPAMVALRDLFEEVVQHNRDFGIAITIETRGGGGIEDAAAARETLPRRPEILHGLTNILENAVDFATREVRIEALVDPKSIRVRIIDDGPGIPREILDRLGEPFVSTRRFVAGEGATLATLEEDHGMGLGFFIAKTLLERTGARVLVRNLAPGEGLAGGAGASVTITWLREDLAAALAGFESAGPPA